MRKIKIGHLGLGHFHSESKLECVRRYPDLFEVVGLAEPDEETYVTFSSHQPYQGLERLSVEALLSRDDLDAVLVECDDWNLVPYGQMCVEAGKHIHLDKPAGESIPDFERLIATARAQGLVVQLGYMYRYNPGVVKCLEMVRNGELGEILQVDAVMSTEHPKWVREWLQRYSGGTMHTFGCHLADLVLLMQGMPDTITAYKKMTLLEGVEVYDHDLAVFEYPRGVSTIRTSSFEVNGVGRRQLVVAGTEGTVELKPLETSDLARFTHMTLATKPDTRHREYLDTKQTVELPPVKGRYDAMMVDFAAMVRGEKENPFTYEYELRVQRASLAACGLEVDLRGAPPA
ncbi:MAG: Gfo/Idh/MocA family oxidoreductase [candidate division WS1 bacterium]|jgi:predicted dehydrogenase|nr:Gfo/Idh/MocA family oxidoreductase [candidate division WS1 bacterium]